MLFDNVGDSCGNVDDHDSDCDGDDDDPWSLAGHPQHPALLGDEAGWAEEAQVDDYEGGDDEDADDVDDDDDDGHDKDGDDDRVVDYQS